MFGRKKTNESRPIPIGRIVPGPGHSRGCGSAAALGKLAASIKTHGLLYPIIVTGGDGEGRYEVVAGLHRLEACRQLGWKEIPAIVMQLTPQAAAEISLLENLHRQPMSESEKLRAVARLLTRWPIGTGFEMIHRLGITREEVEGAIRVAVISPIVKEALAAGLITTAQALRIDDLDSEEDKQTLIAAMNAADPCDSPHESANAAVTPGARTVSMPAEVSPAAAKAADRLRRIGKVIRDWQYQSAIDVAGVQRIVNELIGSLRNSNDEMIHLNSVACLEENYVARHTYNATVVALYIGTSAGLGYDDLLMLGIGSLLHDVGMAQIPPSILAKDGPLTPDEITIVRRHVTDAHAAIAEQYGKRQPMLDVVLQHHERADGSGYPRGLHGHDVTRFARIMNIVDPYVAMTSVRPYRKPYLPHNAMRLLMREAVEGHYDKNEFNNFIRALSYYPIGSYVQLAAGEIAVVTGSNESDTLRPILNVLTDSDRSPLPNPVRIDLLGDPDCKIIQAVPDYAPAAERHPALN